MKMKHLRSERRKVIAALAAFAAAAALISLALGNRNGHDAAMRTSVPPSMRGPPSSSSSGEENAVIRDHVHGRKLYFTDPRTVTLRTGGQPLFVPTAEDGWTPPLGTEDAMTRLTTTSSVEASTLRPYTVANVLLALPHFNKQFFVATYDAATDNFAAYYSRNHLWNSGCGRVQTCGNVLVRAFRHLFKERERQGMGRESSKDLVFLVSVGDNPKVSHNCIETLAGREKCRNDDFAPILGFGSVYTDESLMPSLMAMPMAPKPHNPCFLEWADRQRICRYLLPRFRGGKDHGDGLVFGEGVGLAWDDLIPTVIWRGTDFGFLVNIFPLLRRPNFQDDVAMQTGMSFGDAKADHHAVVRSLYRSWETYLPRWKGVLLTARAELDANDFNHERVSENEWPAEMPWADIKFSHLVENHMKVLALDSELFAQWAELGIPAAGATMDMMEHARYKYQIDLGGGGGTTWTGTILKLSLPGLLFHHETPTKDWIHDHIEPWVHYVPVSTDLSDLKEKFIWAERNPDEAKRISEAATDFARRLGTPEGFGSIYNKYYVDNLDRIMNSYVPELNGRGAISIDAIASMLDKGGLEEVMQCPAHLDGNCNFVGRHADDTDQL